VAILVGDFGAIGTVGLGAMLEAQSLNLETSTVAAEDVPARLAAGGTEVVVLDSGMSQARETAARIAAEHADVRVIICSLDDTTMLVYPGHGEAPYEAPLDPARLAAAIRKPR